MIICGDCLEVMRGMESNSVDTVITDPPYGLKFMGKQWDYDIPSIEIWEECLRVAKPGATLLCFGGSRTYHRMACAIEDAGWVIKDCIMWLYGSGFPKAYDIGKKIESGEWNGWKSHGLKPAYEPIIVAMKPNDKTYVNNALEWGVSGLNIDECRIGYNGEKPNIGGRGKHTRGDGYGFKELGDKISPNTQGRFPSNIILNEEAGKMLDEQSGFTKTNADQNYIWDNTTCSGNTFKGRGKYTPRSDEGGASRFFYCAKANKSEKNAGCGDLEEKQTWASQEKRESNSFDVFESDGRPKTVNRNNHPTVKPLKLMEYLCKLTKTPTGGVVLDCFAGSCTTACACINTGRDYIMIEQDKDYCEIGRARIKYYEEK